MVVWLMLMCLVSANGVSHRPIRVSGRVLGGRLLLMGLVVKVVSPIVLLPLRIHGDDR